MPPRTRCRRSRARCRAAARRPAETTLPLALRWPAPPARPPRAPRPAPSGPPGAPFSPGTPARLAPGAQADRLRAARPGPAALPAAQTTQTPRYPPPGYPAARSTGRPGAGAARPAPRGRPRRSGPAWSGPAPAWRSAPWSRASPASCAPSSSWPRSAPGRWPTTYNNSNTLPNTVYYLMLGGIFTSVVVPLLVRAAKRDPDHGEAYAQRMFTLGALALFTVTWWRRWPPGRWSTCTPPPSTAPSTT